MATINNAKFNGLVMFQRNHRENDLLVKFLTREYGKRMFFIRNAKKANFQLHSAILPFTFGTYSGLIRDNGLSYINAALEIKQFENIFQDISLNAYATFIMNLVDAAFDDNFVIPKWFDIAKQSLALIDAGNDAQVVSDLMQIQLLPSFGLNFNWNKCAVCQRQDVPMDFSDKYNGMLCQNHWLLDTHRWHLTAKTVKILAILSQISPFQVGNISISNHTKQEIWHLLEVIYQDQVGINLKSRNFIDQMEKWNLKR